MRGGIDGRTKQPEGSIAVLRDILHALRIDGSPASEHDRAEHLRAIGRSNRGEAPGTRQRPRKDGGYGDNGDPRQHTVSIRTSAEDQAEPSAAVQDRKSVV